MKYFFFFLFALSLSSTLIAQGPNSWVEKNRFAGFKREQATGCSTTSKGYLGTGVDTAEVVQNDWWEYEPTTDSWTQKSNVPGTGRRCAFSFSLNELVYVGTGIDAAEAQLGTLLNDFYEYNPQSNAWTIKATCPLGSIGVYYATAFTVENKAFVVGGKIGPSSYINQNFEYKPSLNQWIARAVFPGGSRYNMTATSCNGIGYVGLGTNFDNFMSDWFAYNPGSNTWVEKTSFPGGDRAGASSFSISGKVFVCLGTNGGLQGDLYEYNPLFDNWSARSNYGGSDRKQAVAFTINNRAYVGTGAGVSGKKNTMYEYLPLSLLSLESYKTEIQIYPNPCADVLKVKSTFEGFESAIVYSLDGKSTKTYSFLDSNLELDVSDLSEGVYFLKLKHKSGFETYPQQFQIIR
jgi:N-acetylneuraminic acid mutarotase